MNGRTYALIFFAWAVFTVITPTLILLSASSQPEDTDGLLAEAVKLKRLHIPLNLKKAASLTSTSATTGTAYGRDFGFFDLISTLTSFTRKYDSQLLDDPSKGQAV
ncbi:unnamed protein product [Rhodiola kirilowii]